MVKKQINIAVLVSGGGTNLQALIDAQNAGIIKSGKISLVVSNVANAYALTRAEQAKIETAVLLRKDCGGQEPFEQAFIKLLKSKEIDLIVFKDGRYLVIECKAQKAKLDDTFVKKWLNENVPVIRKCLIDRYETDKIDFQLWSVSGFTDAALSLLKKAKEETKKYAIEYYEHDQMLDIAKKAEDQYFIEIMNEHFSTRK